MRSPPSPHRIFRPIRSTSTFTAISLGAHEANPIISRRLRREIKEELPELRLGRVRLWKKVTARNRRSGRMMSDAIFVVKKATGTLKIGDKKEIDRAIWRKPRGIRLTPTSRYIVDRLFPK